ncbi:MAG: multidrug efflux SMR transporter [Rhizobium sp.]|nr:MAG: multidrug efflux SMR transporter [Rhizobium sp.]
MNYLLLSIAIVCEVIATNLLKASDGLSQWLYGGASIALYAVAGYLLSIVLKQMNVGIAYAIWAGAGIALISLASLVIWKQSMDWAAIAGIVLIVAGVALITLKSNSVME